MRLKRSGSGSGYDCSGSKICLLTYERSVSARSTQLLITPVHSLVPKESFLPYTTKFRGHSYTGITRPETEPVAKMIRSAHTTSYQKILHSSV